MDVLQPLPETAQAETEASDSDQKAPMATEQLERLGIFDPLPTVQSIAEIRDNRGEVNLLKVVVTEALKLWKLDPDYLAEVGRSFAEPGESFTSAFSALRGRQRIVILRSKPHSGTRTAALAMIDKLARGACPAALSPHERPGQASDACPGLQEAPGVPHGPVRVRRRA